MAGQPTGDFSAEAGAASIALMPRAPIEHYACCPVVRRFGRCRLQLDDPLEDPWARIARFVSLGTWSGAVDDPELACRAVLNYATYRAVLMHRHTVNPPAQLAIQAMPQFARDAVRGHTKASQLTAWRSSGTAQDRHAFAAALEVDIDDELSWEGCESRRAWASQFPS